MIFRPAVETKDHKALCTMARKSVYISSYSSFMFSSSEAYAKGWIRIAEEDGKILGFTCVRHKVRSPETILYFIMVDPDAEQRKGIGTALLEDLYQHCPHKRLVLKVMKKNVQALNFYEKLGYKVECEAYNGEGLQLSREWQ